MISINEVLQEIVFRIAEIIVGGGNKPEKVVVSEEVYGLLMDIRTMPRSIEYVGGVFYIAGIPVEKGKLDDPKGPVWFQII
ncbi:MAG: hypothetical protein J6S14_12205 [Clostridia bacterium]|nr:hypothetical protein [Clostridia bacterium]